MPIHRADMKTRGADLQSDEAKKDEAVVVAGQVPPLNEASKIEEGRINEV
jgi:hypothetical protein